MIITRAYPKVVFPNSHQVPAAVARLDPLTMRRYGKGSTTVLRSLANFTPKPVYVTNSGWTQTPDPEMVRHAFYHCVTANDQHYN